jgi:hypothetical protein
MLNKVKDFEKLLCWLHVTQKTNEISPSAQIRSTEMVLRGGLGYQFVGFVQSSSRTTTRFKISVVCQMLFLFD